MPFVPSPIHYSRKRALYHSVHHSASRCLTFALLLLLLTACAPTPEGNVIGYTMARWLGTLDAPPTTANSPRGILAGRVVDTEGAPIEGAAVVVASRTGTPFAAYTDDDGYYAITEIPPGQYVPAAAAPGYEETVPAGWLQIPWLVTVRPNEVTELSPIVLHPHHAQPLPAPLPDAVNLRATGAYTATAPFPVGAAAQIHTFSFDYAGATIDSLRVYLPLNATPDHRLPTLYMIYPTAVEDWEDVSVAFANAGYAFLAISPSPARELDIDAHAQDARIGLALARGGHLHPALAQGEYILLGGSFSSAIQNRLMRDESDAVVAWITVGGISNAFSGAADFYDGTLEMPPQYELLIPALGAPNLYPMLFMRYSPVYTAAQLPPTLIIHTADKVSPIDQAFQLECALKAAGVPTETYYYEDVSHNLPIGEHLTPAGEEMFQLILDFAQRYQSLPPRP